VVEEPEKLPETRKEIPKPNAVIAREDAPTTRLRMHPRDNSEFNGIILYEGDPVTVLATESASSEADDGYWTMVQEGRRRGWIKTQYVRPM
jgi:hypothetical protein